MTTQSQNMNYYHNAVDNFLIRPALEKIALTKTSIKFQAGAENYWIFIYRNSESGGGLTDEIWTILGDSEAGHYTQTFGWSDLVQLPMHPILHRIAHFNPSWFTEAKYGARRPKQVVVGFDPAKSLSFPSGGQGPTGHQDTNGRTSWCSEWSNDYRPSQETNFDIGYQESATGFGMNQCMGCLAYQGAFDFSGRAAADCLAPRSARNRDLEQLGDEQEAANMSSMFPGITHVNWYPSNYDVRCWKDRGRLNVPSGGPQRPTEHQAYTVARTSSPDDCHSSQGTNEIQYARYQEASNPVIHTGRLNDRRVFDFSQGWAQDDCQQSASPWFEHLQHWQQQADTSRAIATSVHTPFPGTIQASRCPDNDIFGFKLESSSWEAQLGGTSDINHGMWTNPSLSHNIDPCHVWMPEDTLSSGASHDAGVWVQPRVGIHRERHLEWTRPSREFAAEPEIHINGARRTVALESLEGLNLNTVVRAETPWKPSQAPRTRNSDSGPDAIMAFGPPVGYPTARYM
ncbi:hypothetical protein C8R47DRAFT_1134216 [Mycena vitilis]|nr:hypothetical protein C8R47DRAFT_1134216 [Mycena vitilis]